MIPELAFAFVAGTVATANPCGFALLPAFVAGQLGGGGARRTRDAVARALVVGGLTTVGFLIVFGTVGTAMTLGARWLSGLIPWAALAIGAALILAGLALLTGRRIPLRLPPWLPSGAEGGRRSALLFGLAYGLTSLSCTLPIFLVVVGAALTVPSLGVPLMFAAYALGMGTILSALAVAAALSRAGVAARVRRVLPYVDRLAAILLIVAGAYVVYYWSFGLFAPDATGSATAPLDAGTRLSSGIQVWLRGEGGTAVSALLAAALAIVILWAVGTRARSSRRAAGPLDPRASDGLAHSQREHADAAASRRSPSDPDVIVDPPR